MTDEFLRTISLGRHQVPAIWKAMLPDDVFYFRVDDEKDADCFNCPMVKEAGFNRSIRCCAHLPRVSNFLLGLALMDPKTRPLIEGQIEAGYATPEGMQHSPAQLRHSLRYPSPVDARVICPFLDARSKRCGIYNYRNSVCSSFFCKHERGAASQQFWIDLQDLVGQVEAALSQWVMGEVGMDLDAYFARFDALDLKSYNDHGYWSEDARAALFQGWYGREAEFFLACAEKVIAHKDELFAIASAQKLRQPLDYEKRLREQLQLDFPVHLVAESLPEGQPETIQKLWYSLRLSQRNMQLSPKSNSVDSLSL